MNEENRPSITRRPRKPSQALSGRLASIALILSTVLGLVRVLINPDGLDVLLTATVVCLILFAMLFGWFFADNWLRSRRLRELSPDSLIVPLNVTDDLVQITMRLARRLDSPGVQLGTEKVATIAVDSTGVHIVSAPDRPIGHIPAELVSVAGFGSALVGVREFASLVLRVTIDSEDYDLQIVTTDSTSGLSMLSIERLEQLAGEIRSRLSTASA